MWLLLVALLLSSCSDQIKVVGFAPDSEKELIGKKIDELSQKFLIAPDIRSKGSKNTGAKCSKYYLGQTKYSYNKIRGSYKTLTQTVYMLNADKDGKVTKAVLLPPALKQVKLYDSMPTLPDRSSLLSKLFADVGSVSIL